MIHYFILSLLVIFLSTAYAEEKRELLLDFQEAYRDLQLTVGEELPSFETLPGNRLVHAIKNTRIIEVNASRGRTPEIRWSDFYSHILITILFLQLPDNAPDNYSNELKMAVLYFLP